jgi:hypothetical protein
MNPQLTFPLPTSVAGVLHAGENERKKGRQLMGEIDDKCGSVYCQHVRRAIPSPVAIVGVPGGLEVRHDQLKALVRSGRIDAYEVIGREVVFLLALSDKPTTTSSCH